MFYSVLSVILSGLSFGAFLAMVGAYRDSGHLAFDIFPEMTVVLVEGMLLYLAIWGGYSLLLARLVNKDIRSVLKNDGYTYLPSILLLLYVFQFYGPINAQVNYFAGTYAGFSGEFLLAPAKMLALIVFNLTVFVKILREDTWSNKIESFFSDGSRVKKILGATAGIYLIVFSTLSILQYLSFNTTYDLATYNQAFWNTVNGRFFHTSLQEHVHPGIEIASTFSLHFSPVYFFILPFYAIYPHVNTLLVFQTLFLALGAVPVYLLGRHKLGDFGGLVFSLVYLFFPSVAYINLFDFHEVALAPFLLLFTFYYFEKKNYRRFLLFMVLSLMIKEIIAMSIFMFGVYAAIKRRKTRWVVTPILLSMLWFFGSLYLIIPLFGNGYVELLSGLYPDLGGSLFGIVKTIILHPIYTLKLLLAPAKIIYVILLLFPVGFLAILNPASLLLTAPLFLRNMLASHRYFYEINFHYTADIIPFIMASAILGTGALIAKVNNKRFTYALLVFILLNGISAHALYGPSPIGMFYNAEKYTLDERTLAGERIVKMVPQDVPVAPQIFYITHLSQRERVFIIWNDSKLFETHEGIEYSVIDTQRTFDEIFPPWDFLFNSPEWGIVYELEGHVLVQKGVSDALALYEVLDEKPSPVTEGNFENDEIKLLGYDVTEESVEDGYRVLRISYFWECIKSPDLDYTINLVLLDEAGDILQQKEQKPTYGLYPTSSWKPGMIIKETHGILIPEKLERGSYSFSVSLE